MIARDGLERLFFALEPAITAVLYPLCSVLNWWTRQVRVPIFMYHQVGDAPKGARFCRDAVSSARFDQQIEAILAAGYRVIPLGTCVQQLQSGPAKALERTVVLTFDDGLSDQFVNAHATLRRHRLPATHFLVAGYVGKNALLPHLSLAEAAHGADSGWRTLSWDDALQMTAEGATIGCHSLSHRSMGVVAPGELESEVQGSKEMLEQRLNTSVDAFAYPFGSETYGDCRQGVQDALRRAGYRAACMSVVGSNRRGVDPFQLRRIPIEERDGPFRIRCKLAGAYDWVGTVKRLWQRLVAREDHVDVGSVLSPGFRGGWQ